MLDHDFSLPNHSQPLAAGVNVLQRALDDVTHHDILEQIVDIVCLKTGNKDRSFFRAVTCYFFAKMAAAMRATITTPEGDDIPVNVYTVALAGSGFGKGKSVKILEKQFVHFFRKRFMDDALPVISEKSLYDRACDRALISGKDPADEKERLDKEFAQKGGYPFTFDSGTREGVRQIRDKLILANIGSINYQVDEIGSNLISNVELLTLFFELYDLGELNTKLVKNSHENIRGEELEGQTPTNALLFGTPVTLFDGATVEAQFQAFLEAGYARRCFFAWGEKKDQKELDQENARAKYAAKLKAVKSNQNALNIAQHFAMLADPARYHWEIQVPVDVGEELAVYQAICQSRAAALSQYDAARRYEMEHRYFKVMKLAGAFAFIDESSEITMDNLYQAIKIAEESGIAFEKMLRREKNYVRLARYIAEKGSELTHPELHETLPFYKADARGRNELMGLARDWGYKNHIIIRKYFKDEGIEVFSGETLKQTNLSKISFSWSDHVAFNYSLDSGPFDQLGALVQLENPERPGEPMHWCTHGFKNGHRSEEDAIPGFNLVVLDIDGGIPLHVAHDLMSEYAFLTYTTKRHDPNGVHRFRMLLPTNYFLYLDKTDYREFMTGVLSWLPFSAPTDDGAIQISRKWLTHPGGQLFINPSDKLLDVLPFIPRTSRNEQHQTKMQELESLDNLERWFAQRIGPGNRNNQLIKYALALVDAGKSYAQVEEALISFNRRLAHGLTEDELRSTILVTVAKKIHGKP